MKKQYKILIRTIQIIFILLPVLLGTIGFCRINGGNIIDAAYTSCRLYGMDADIPDGINGYVEAARWLAPLAAASGILLLIESFGKRFSGWLRSFRGNSVAVYGNSASSRLLLSRLGHIGISPYENRIVPAGKHVILFDTDEENIDFYTKNQNLLEDKQVYIHLNELNHLSVNNPKLHVFSMTEIAARLFWRDMPIPFDKVESGVYKILIIGFSDLGQEILKYGLLNNIFSPNQQIEYHIFGEIGHFFDLHRELDKMAPDKIVVHKKSLYEAKKIVQKADRIIFCDNDRENLVATGNLLAYYNLKPDVELFASVYDKDVLKLIGTEETIKPFASLEEIYDKDYILNEKLNWDAIATHELYNSNVEDPAKRVAWEDLSAFLRYSNISSADFKAVRKRYIDYYKDTLSGEQIIDNLTELEHIRWCRYHYMNNWVLGEEKNNVLRTHPCLIPFKELSQEEIDKDKVIVEKFYKEYVDNK